MTKVPMLLWIVKAVFICLFRLNPLSHLRLEDRRRRSWGPTSTFKLTG